MASEKGKESDKGRLTFFTAAEEAGGDWSFERCPSNPRGGEAWGGMRVEQYGLGGHIHNQFSLMCVFTIFTFGCGNHFKHSEKLQECHLLLTYRPHLLYQLQIFTHIYKITFRTIRE